MSPGDEIRIAAMVRTDPAGGIHRDDLAARLGGLSWPQLAPPLFQAYRKRWIDFCGPYIVHVPSAMRGKFITKPGRVRARGIPRGPGQLHQED